MENYRNCDICGESYKDEHMTMPEICTPCWYIPSHIPECQYDRVYKVRYEKSKHKKMLLLRQTNS